MGMYTEVWFRAVIKPESVSVVGEVVNAKWVNRSGGPEGHPLFATPRWPGVFHGSSFYFPQSGFFHFGAPLDYEDIDKWGCVLAFHTSLKSYDNEVPLFFDWIGPHVQDYDASEFIGYSLYEEALTPTLYYSRQEDE